MTKKEIDIGGKTRLKPLSIRLIFTGLAFIIGVVGFQLLRGTRVFDWIVSTFALLFALVGATEIGLKRFTKLSELKKFGVLQWIGSFIILTLVVFSVVNFFGLFTISAMNQIVGTIFIGSALVTAFDVWV